jgi:hypothetical protein
LAFLPSILPLKHGSWGHCFPYSNSSDLLFVHSELLSVPYVYSYKMALSKTTIFVCSSYPIGFVTIPILTFLLPIPVPLFHILLIPLS